MNKIIMFASIMVGLSFMFGISMVFAAPIEDRIQQFIGDEREVHQYEPIQIKYWSYSSKHWVHNTIDGNGWSSENTHLEIIILQNERIIKLLEKQNDK
jgi:hypothetical protein